ncbi:hypothetical protein EYE40_07455 [Glaciihabitans arcticus]|uniref:Recombinase XerD n=1 Tax=Glaciihabitans arcticus TaxID=2668039 RepID=A0A4Q9GVL9_9MICO|nr:hypothetical protein [Glaciihabitans arcticus]TBN57247.1 hypothetical protein EYE40_07455 [Glaciihabitans arcticus]
MARPIGRMLGGFVCSSCYGDIKRHARACPICGEHRILSELGDAGNAVCATCAGAPERYGCTRCGSERFYVGALCGACLLSDSLDAAFGQRESTPFATALHDHFNGRQDPRNARAWLLGDGFSSVLSDMAFGRLPVDHATVDSIPGGPRRQFVRELLIECDVLPSIDHQLHNLELWITEFCAKLPANHALIVHEYATWTILRRLRRSAEYEDTRKTQGRAARHTLRGIVKFLEWMDDNDVSLRTLPQPALETFLSSVPHESWMPAFIVWARRAHGTRASAQPARRTPPSLRISELQRLAVYRAIINDDRPPGHRLACALLVVFGISINRISQLRPSTFEVTNDQVRVTLSPGKSTPLPGPLATLFRLHVLNLPADNEWLFPGRRFNRHITPDAIGTWMKRYGIPSTHLRVAALYQLAGEMSSKLLSETTGLSASTAGQYVSASGSGWNEIPVLYDPDWASDLVDDAVGEMTSAVESEEHPLSFIEDE